LKEQLGDILFISFVIASGEAIIGGVPVDIAHFSTPFSMSILKDEVLLTVSCPIFPSILMAKYLFTGSLKNRSIDNLETQKKYFNEKFPIL
jgi:hypothetical protein